jgi:hypothetical protein
MVKVAERMPRSGGVGVALGYSSTLYSITRLLGYSVTRLLGYSVTRLLGYSVTRLLGPDARFWTTRAKPDHSRRYATIHKNG